MNLVLAATEAAPLANRGYPALAHVLALVGIALVVGGFLTTFGALERWAVRAEWGFGACLVGAGACMAALVVAP